MTQNQLQPSDYYIHQTFSNNYDELNNQNNFAYYDSNGNDVPLYIITHPTQPNYYNMSNQNHIPNYDNQTLPNNYEIDMTNNNLTDNVLTNNDLTNNDLMNSNNIEERHRITIYVMMFIFVSIFGIGALIFLMTSKK